MGRLSLATLDARSDHTTHGPAPLPPRGRPALTSRRFQPARRGRAETAPLNARPSCLRMCSLLPPDPQAASAAPLPVLAAHVRGLLSWRRRGGSWHAGGRAGWFLPGGTPERLFCTGAQSPKLDQVPCFPGESLSLCSSLSPPGAGGRQHQFVQRFSCLKLRSPRFNPAPAHARADGALRNEQPGRSGRTNRITASFCVCASATAGEERVSATRLTAANSRSSGSGHAPR